MLRRRLSSSAARREAAVSGSWELAPVGLTELSGERGCFCPACEAELKWVGEVADVGEAKNGAATPRVGLVGM